MTTPPLYLRLYQERPLWEAARIIGYGGCQPFDFWDAAKKLGMPQQQMMNAVYDLTRTDRREASPPRYELTDPARKACWQLLGPPPGHELHGRLVEGPPLYSDEEHRRWQERLKAEKQAKESPAETPTKPKRTRSKSR